MTGSRLGPGGFFMAAAFAWTSQYSLVPMLKYPFKEKNSFLICSTANKYIEQYQNIHKNQTNQDD